ncbi:MAG: hypothetical protein A3E87_06140 [Gammaproteobacteria bacterium RIFCSPHIGHO2_12_FULL_35_23]|nr:MAG: hypothetical protein A3E87_06140 [Gammaproteobacteria bacterium RIFCSPHIGHO2_12_FULL_35_23]
MTIYSKIKKNIAHFMGYFAKNEKINVFIPTHRLIAVFEDTNGEYIAKIQIINKNLAFNAKPEEILAKDEYVNRFSPCDIRALTYLGYLGINSPKYKILAKQLSENDEKLIFALRKKGDTKVVTRTADEIINEKDILKNLNPNDAHVVGYTLACESIKAEKKQKEEALEQFKKSD